MPTNHAERNGPPPCPHEREHGEGVVWPDDVSLEHFDKCLTPDGRLWVWGGARRMADQGSRCIMADHAGKTARTQALLEHISMLQQVQRTDRAYISSMVEQLRELRTEILNNRVHPEDMAERLEGILETRTQSVEQVEP